MQIKGYIREDGRVGIRNHIAIIPTSVCATTVAQNIASQVAGAVALANQHGCCQMGEDHVQTVRTLIGLGKNPNVAAVLVVGLGCEGIPIQEVAAEIASAQKPVESIIIQELGGTVNATARGIELANRMARQASTLPTQTVDISELTLAIECGGSDFTSGLASNPAVGQAADLVINNGGSVILSETTEFIGAEHVLARRAVSAEIAQKLIEIVSQCELRAKNMNVDLRGSQPTPGNIAGGISSIEEKSLGCIYKAGTSPIQDILAYGQAPPKSKGLYIMDSPGQDVESITGMVAGGAQVVVFTTGRGTPTGFPLAPVIKITGNAQTFKQMEDNIDLDVSTIISGKESIAQAGERIFQEVLAVANGKLTKAESLKHHEFGIYRIGPTF